MVAELRTLRWQGTENTYRVPWSRKKVAFSAQPEQVADFAQCPFTRSKLSMDMLVRFHLSNNSIVVSEDSVASFLRSELREHAVPPDRYPAIAVGLVTDLFGTDRPARGAPRSLSCDLIRFVYIGLLSEVLGVDIGASLRQTIDEAVFKRGTRPMEVDGVLFAVARVLPGVRALRYLVDRFVFKGDHYSRQLALQTERSVLADATALPGSWYQKLQQLESEGRITHRQMRGEVTSIFVSAYTLSAAMSSLLLCIAARPDEMEKVRSGEVAPKSFVNEVLRLYPPFRCFGYEHLDANASSRGDSADLMLSLGQLQRNPEVWADADDFRPSRFTDGGATKGYKFLPFGMGSRSCSGRSYSLKVMIEVVRYVCSDECNLEFSLPADYEGDAHGLPVPILGRLLSFPADDRIVVSQRDAAPLIDAATSTPGQDAP